MAMAGEGEGSFFGNLLNRVVSGSGVSQVTAPGDGKHLSNQINTFVNPAPQTGTQALSAQPQSSYPQAQGYPSTPTMVQPSGEELVRCVYLGKYIDQNKRLEEESVEAQLNRKRTGELYAKLNCNALLVPYNHVFKQVDQALTTCFANEDCQSANLEATSNGSIKK